MIKRAESITVGALLSEEQDFDFYVPRYQREYSWTKDQLSYLFDDFVEAEVTDSHFIGSIICIDKSDGVLGRTTLEVVDGQQRLTTLTILLARLYKQLKDRKDQFEGNDDAAADLVNLKRNLVNKQGLPRLQPQIQGQNKEDLTFTLKLSGLDFSITNQSNFGNRRIGKAVKYFDSRISSHIEDRVVDGLSELAAVNELVSKVKGATLVLMEVLSHADAFALFETLNNRGLPLTPIDLIKNQLLERASKNWGVEKTYNKWTEWLQNLGEEYRDQERFFRQFYNAFKNQWELTVPNAPVATRTKLISIYGAIVSNDFDNFIPRMDKATRCYATVIGNAGFESSSPDLRSALTRLDRVEGAPAYTLLLSLLLNQDRFGLSDSQLAAVVDSLVSFFVRRNLTQVPLTNSLDKLFMELVEMWTEDVESSLSEFSLKLKSVSSSDQLFETKLREGVYEENRGVTRFILASLEERNATKEIHLDLWAQEALKGDKLIYVWTIEHIIPQGRNLPTEWIQMLGGTEAAEEFQQMKVHTLGNLTLTGYNSTLSNLDFLQKRDRKKKNNDLVYVGYRNGLSLNDDLKDATFWNQKLVDERTGKMVQEILDLFPL